MRARRLWLLGELVGLGGAEFRLPLLLTVLGFAALAAVIVNKAMSLVVVAVAIPTRLGAAPFGGGNRRVDSRREPACPECARCLFPCTTLHVDAALDRALA
jgi:hypothetical protein